MPSLRSTSAAVPAVDRTPPTRGAGRRTRRFAAAALLAAFAAVCWPDPRASTFLPRCPLLHLTGCYCPGCGGLRAMHALLHGQFGAALRLNPLLVFALPLALLAVFRPTWFGQPRVLGLAVVTLVVFGILRNVPGWPAELLAPHEPR